MNVRYPLGLSLLLIIFISGCAQGKTVSSLQVLDKSFIRDSQGLPIVVLLVGEVKLDSSADYSCRPTYAGQLVEKSITQKGTSGNNQFTITVPESGRADIGEWGICCGAGKTLDEKTATTVCGE